VEEAVTPRSATGESTWQQQAKRHLWMHFTRMGAYADHEVPVLVRGEGCYVWDEHGKRYLDGLSALFCVNAGHGRAELAQALSATGLTALRAPCEPLTPGGCHVPNTNSYRWPEERDPLWAADAIEERIEFEGPETVAGVILEPVQNAGGCFVPQDGYFQRVR